MKTKFVVLAALASALCGSLFAADSAASSSGDARVEVTYVNPDKFTDFTDSSDYPGRGVRDYGDGFKEYLAHEAARVIPEGARLTISFTEIDMAGEFEPWRGPRFSDIRIVKDLYPPRLNFTYKLTDASGAVLKEGEAKLRDVNFLMNAASSISNDPLRHEKSMMDDWLRAEFPKAKKQKASASKS
jgi:hypothetical protein